MSVIEIDPDDRSGFIDLLYALGVSANDQHTLAVCLLKICEEARNYQIGHELYERGLSPPPGRRRHSEKICKILETTVAVLRQRNGHYRTKRNKEA